MSSKTLLAKIPFHVEMRRLYRGGERLEHDLSFGVVGIEKPASVIVASDILPRVLRYRRRGGLDLPPTLLDGLVVICLSRLIENMVLSDGRDTEVEVPDGAEWLQRSLAPSEAALAIAALGKHIDPANTVRDFSWLRHRDG